MFSDREDCCEECTYNGCSAFVAQRLSDDMWSCSFYEDIEDDGEALYQLEYGNETLHEPCENCVLGLRTFINYDQREVCESRCVVRVFLCKCVCVFLCVCFVSGARSVLVGVGVSASIGVRV